MTDRTPSLTYTAFERSLLERIKIIEQRNIDLEAMYDKAAADLIDALDVASAYRATASTLHQEVERRNGAERRQASAWYSLGRNPAGNTGEPRVATKDRRKSWPR
jgi:hypothetical protein